jgi:salicylate hydroxylase
VLGARATALHERGDGVIVSFDQRPPWQADLAVGADGIKSIVRSYIVGTDAPVHTTSADAPVFTGQLAWRCTVPIERIAPALRTDIVSTIWCGPRNHAVTYYLRAGRVLNFVGCVERAADEESWTTRRPWQDLSDDYAGWHPMVRAVIDALDREPCFRLALYRRTPIERWSSARVTLLGDAVHATLPYMAQGAAMAIEDAAVLARALDDDRALPEQLALYHRHRGPRTARVIRESDEMGELYHIADAASMRAAFTQRDIARSRNEWLYPYDPWTCELE